MGLTGWMIYPREVARHSNNAFVWLTQEAGRCGIDLRIVFAEDIEIGYGAEYTINHEGVPIVVYPDFVVTRIYDYVISRHFELRGIPVINTAESMALCKDKMLTHQLLAAHGVPTPLTVRIVGGGYDYGRLCDRFGAGQFIVKRADGAKGEDVFLVGGDDELMRAVEACGGNAICQQFVAESRGRDVRVWTVGGRAVAAVERYSETSFLSNFSQGGRVREFPLTDEAAALAGKASELLGVEFAGVDLLFGRDGLIVNEVNGNAGFRTLSRIVDPNPIPRQLFEYIKNVLENKL